jgi:general secretion pathway protein I
LNRHYDSGFTLLEVMIALAIMAGVVVTIIGAVNHHLGLAARDREETVAVLLARGKLAEPGFATQETTAGTFAPAWPEYSWRRELLPTETIGLKRLVLTISWQEKRQTMALVQYVAQ